jgi:hypothetical protein
LEFPNAVDPLRRILGRSITQKLMKKAIIAMPFIVRIFFTDDIRSSTWSGPDENPQI